jgi:hypothetical protein
LEVVFLVGIDADIEITEETLKKVLDDDVEASLNDKLAPVKREMLAMLQTMIAEVLETFQGNVSQLYDHRIEEDPTQVQVTTRAKREFISNMQRRANGLKLAIVSYFKPRPGHLTRQLPGFSESTRSTRGRPCRSMQDGIQEYDTFKRKRN